MKLGRALALIALLVAWLGAGAVAQAECGGAAGGIGGTGRGEQPGEGMGGTGFEDPGDGIGGTGRDPGDGIGGTGRDPGDGIGGTGRDPGDGIGGTGVFGVVSGVSPLCVSGVAVAVGPNAAVTRHGEPAELAVGQVVWALGLASSDDSSEELLATQIEIVVALRGSIDSHDADLLHVAGRPVQVPKGLPIVDAHTGERIDRDQLRAGSRVEISGLEDSAMGLVATRIERLGETPRPPLRPFDLATRARDKQVSRVTIEGVLAHPSAPDRLRVAGVEALLPERASRPEALRPGDRVRIRGRIEASGSLRAERVVRVERPARVPERPAPVPVPAPSPTPAVPDRPPVAPESGPAPERPERPDTGVLLERPERPVRPEVPPRPEPPGRPPERPAIERPDVPDKLDRPASDIRSAPVRAVRPAR